MLGFRRKIHVKVTASTYGRLSVVSDIMKCSTTQAVELLTNAFLDNRYPGIQEVGEQKVRSRENKKEQEANALFGIPFIDNMIMEKQDEIGAWIMGTLKDPQASAKKKEVAGALGNFMGLDESIVESRPDVF